MNEKRKEVTKEMMDEWATYPDGPVALHLRERLVSVEGEDGVVFPPTYADIGYNIDTLSDGKKVATIDSVGSQANRMEPLFEEEPLKDLVPQITIDLGDGNKLSIFKVSHRLADALIRCTDLAEEAKAAFEAWKNGDAVKLAKLAPTSIVFGSWDSRDTQAQIPRIVQSVIRAWDVEPLTRSATYFPPVDYAKLGLFSEDEKKEKKLKDLLAEQGFVHVPSVRTHGGVVVKGDIYRDITINLVALRRLRAPDKTQRGLLRRYILGLSLAVAIQPMDGFLRQGCLLVPDPNAEHRWEMVMCDGTRHPVIFDNKVVLDYAKKVAGEFGVGGVKKEITFDKKKAKEEVQKAKKEKNK